ncbi:MAG: NAD(P)H-quinone oxidoreductase, partial [Caulobacterales bacterium]|nr:NAD(P)H-quinone oxidoreductase [Caulobacterales bacterium]
IFQRFGLYPPPPNASPLLGLEVSGIIIEIGDEVKNFKIGDEICALLNGGGYAQYAIAEEGVCFKKPKMLTFIEAASIPETIMTVYENVFNSCGLKTGQNFLVHGGASGIGVMAIQMAKAIGAKIFTTVGSDEKANFCQSLGADITINYASMDFEKVIRENGGVDVILDMVGGPYIQKNINILNEGGNLCYIAFLQGANTQINFMRLMLKRLNITGSTLRSRSDEDKALIANGVKNDFWPYIENGQIKPIIDSVFRFEDVQAAHDLMQSNKHIGKIILEI